MWNELQLKFVSNDQKVILENAIENVVCKRSTKFLGLHVLNLVVRNLSVFALLVPTEKFSRHVLDHLINS